MIVRELRQSGPVGAVEHLAFALGGDADNRLQRAVPNDGGDDVAQLTGHLGVVGLAERCVDLGARIRPVGQLQVPAGIVAPVRRRSVIRCRARSWSGVSK